MKKVGIIVPDGVGIKNYLFSEFTEKLFSNQCKVLIWHRLSKDAISEITKDRKFFENFQFETLPEYKEPKLLFFIRELIAISRIKYNVIRVNNKSILHHWKKKKVGSKAVFYFIIELLATFFSRSYRSILFLEYCYEKFSTWSLPKTYSQFIKKNEISVLFCTHQRAIHAVPAILAAKKLKIKNIGAIYSWDNIPKGILTVRSDEYFVWSAYMKHQMSIFYPEIHEKSVHVTGTPQFEFYNKKEFLEDKKDFFEKYGLDINKKVICFSGDDTRTSPYDPNYLEDIAVEVSKIPESRRPQIAFRRCPVDLSGRYQYIIEKYEDLIVDMPPMWNFDSVADWSLIYPRMDDVKLLTNVVHHFDAVVNVGSTMAHDFAICNKPAIYINYDIKEDLNWSTHTIYKLQHFRSMPDSQSVIWLNNKREIKEVILKSLYEENELSNKEWLNIISEDRNQASYNIANMLSC